MAIDTTLFGLQGFIFPAPVAVPCDYPSTGDVRSGVTYANGVMVGTLGGGSLPADWHSAADVVRYALVNIGTCANPPTLPWPGFVSNEPGTPDNSVTLFDTAGRLNGRNMLDGGVIEHYGIQVRVRSTNHIVGYSKIKEITRVFDKVICQTVVNVGGNRYVIYNVSRTSDIIALGTESPKSKREIFTVNAVVAYDRVS